MVINNRKQFSCRVIVPLIIIAALLPFSVFADTNYRFSHITGNDGLPCQQINAIMQDNYGRIWIGTRNGLARYDGYEIQNYYYSKNQTNSLPSNTITSIFQDSKERIWIGCDMGICRYLPESDSFKFYALDGFLSSEIVETLDGRIICSGRQLLVYDEENDKFNTIPRTDTGYIISMAVDNQNRVFVATNKTIFYYDSQFKQTTQISPEYFSDFITGFDGIIPLKFDSNGLLWVGRNGKGLMKINLTTKQKTIYTPSQLSDGTVRSITEDHQHKMWIGTEKGVTIIHPNDSIEVLRQNFIDNTGLNDNAVYSIMCDNNNNIWIGTYFGGINLLLRKNERFQWIKPGYGPKNISGKAVREIEETINGTLWVATEDGGVNICNNITGDVQKFNRIPELGSNVHSLLYCKSKDEMWIGTFRNGLFQYGIKTGAYKRYMPSDHSGLSSDAIFSIAQQRNGTIWVGTTQGLRYYNDKNDKFNRINHNILDIDFVYCLLVDNADNVWVGTRNNGLFRIDAKTQEIIGWNKPTITDNYIICLYQDSYGKIWVGTDNGNLQYIDTEGLLIHNLSENIVLSGGSVCSIVEDNDKQLWITKSNGLYKLNKTRSTATLFTTEDGLPTNQFNYASTLIAKNGRMYIGSTNGLISFDPQKIDNDTTHFIVSLKNLVIDNVVQTTETENTPLTAELDKTEMITLTHDQARSFSIEYVAISPGNANSISYQTRLLGYNDKWGKVNKETVFVGSNLPAGKYTLQIRANIPDLGWENAPMKELVIVIKPPFYKSTYAYLIYLILIALAIYFVQRLINIRIQDKNEVRLANMENQKIQEINKIKLDFFTTVSHELKTPLSLIIGPLKELSHDSSIKNESAEMLDTAIKNTQKMVGLIDELVTFNKVETGTFKFYLQQGNPLEFIEKIVHLFKDNAKQKDITLTSYCENNGEVVWFSPSYVERIINNLLTNALKFTNAGGSITVNSSIDENSSDGHTYLHIEVKDTGIGIAQEELTNIFSPYYQTKRGHTKNHRGWGLGLALVKKLSEIHKGNVSVESTIGKGSVFSVNLSIDERDFDPSNRINSDKSVVQLPQYEFSIPELANANATTDVIKSESETMKPTVLLVEDNTELLTFLTGIFSHNYNIITAENGEDGLKCATTNHVDLIISDVMMPIMDGLTFCKKIKTNIDTSHIPVILLTAKNDAKEIIEGYESGADAYIQKPFDPQILVLQVSNIIKDRSNLREKIIETPDSNEIEESQLSSFDKKFINNISELIDNNMDNEDFSVTDITAALGISRSLLHVKMKSLLNISAGDFIRKKRMSHACSLLKEGYNVSETSYRCGFSEPNYFSKVFKKEFGVTPTEWLIQNKNG